MPSRTFWLACALALGACGAPPRRTDPICDSIVAGGVVDDPLTRAHCPAAYPVPVIGLENAEQCNRDLNVSCGDAWLIYLDCFRVSPNCQAADGTPNPDPDPTARCRGASDAFAQCRPQNDVP